MQNRPTAAELLQAVRELLTDEITPTIQDSGLRFKALIAANLLAITERELTQGESLMAAELARLRVLIQAADTQVDNPETATHTVLPEGLPLPEQITRLNVILAAFIRNEQADTGDFAEQVYAHVKQTLADQLKISNPKFLAKFN